MTSVQKARAAAVVASRRRIDTLLKRFDAAFPTALFALLFGWREWEVRQRRRQLGLNGVAVRIDRFARTKELPKLSGLHTPERDAVVAFWNEQCRSYGRTERVRRLREILPSCSESLPSTAIGRMFGIKGISVARHQQELGVQLPAKRANELLKRFIRAKAPPTVSILSPVEAASLRVVWQEMRDESGQTRREREDLLLAGLSDRLPTVYFAEKFGLTTEAVCARRRELKITCTRRDSERLLAAFLKWRSLPTLPYLDAEETSELREIWRRVTTRTRERKRARRKKVDTALLARLNRAKKRYRGSSKPVKCASAKCKYRWPRTATFFQKNRHQPDGLDTCCKLCRARQRANRVPGTRAKPRIIKGAERDRAREIVRANVQLIPARLLKELLNINGNHLMFLRREAGVTISTSESWFLFINWMIADEMPTVAELNDAELSALRAIWERERNAYAQSRTDDDGKLNLQLQERDELLAKGTRLPMLECKGPYCSQQGRTWPASSQFFRRYGCRCKPEDRRCHACSNRERREQDVKNRRENGGRVK